MQNLIQHRSFPRMIPAQMTEQQNNFKKSAPYRNTSQVKELMKNDTHSKGQQRYQPYETKQCNNPITQSSNFFRVPKISAHSENIQRVMSNKVTTQHQSYMGANKKFSKPYSECTKYIDNLSQHKNLIRRGPFNIPIQKQHLLSKRSTFQTQLNSRQIQAGSRQSTLGIEASRMKALSHTLTSQLSKQNIQYKSVFRKNKQMIYKSLNNLKMSELETRQSISKSVNKFDKSLESYSFNYKKLMNKQRNLKEEDIILKNSVNKFIAVDLINQKLINNSPFKKNNLLKIHKKFKKHREIIVKAQN